MKKFSVEAERTDVYEIEIDEKIWNKKELKAWSKSFFDIETLEELSVHISNQILRFGSNRFIEGFGFIKTHKKDRTLIPAYDGNKLVREIDYAKGIRVRIVTEDDDYNFSVSE
jgi:hypothetical protein